MANDVKRYDIIRCQGYSDAMEKTDDGEWVYAGDYDTLRTRLAELEAERDAAVAGMRSAEYDLQIVINLREEARRLAERWRDQTEPDWRGPAPKYEFSWE